jgi:hypothetical protein
VPTRLLLEGPDITELLARVRAEHGDSARIVKAEKLRVGGFAGFFAKQRYEVVLEIADGAPSAVVPAAAAPAVPVGTSLAVPAPVQPAAAPASLEELAALADRADTAELVESAHRVPATTGAGSPAPSPTSLDVLADRAPGRTLSTESDDFASVLSRLADGLGTGFDALPPAPVEVPADFRPLYGAPVASPAELSVAPPAAPLAVRGPVAPPATVAPAAVARSLDGPYESLRGLGVPVHLAAAVNGDDLHADLVRVFTSLPAPPPLPRRPGDVLVVMGDLASAVPVGRALAAKLRLDPARLLVAGPTTAGTGVLASRRISGPADAERRARRMHRDDVPHVVVVDVPIEGDAGDWAQDVADALGANSVWAVVDATRKTADLSDHLRRLGHVDALVVQRADITRDPAALLDLRIPVALLDGRSATPRAWADLISDRMDADAAAAAEAPRRRGRRS